MNRSDPYERESAFIYECLDCSTHVRSEATVTDCPECGGSVRNIGVPRE